jgi:hypothetical protein
MDTIQSLNEDQERQKSELFQRNQERVQFSKPTVKHIVSPHSGSILAKPESVAPIDENLKERCIEIFGKLSVDGILSKDKIAEVLLKCGFEHDISLLTKIANELYSGPETLEQTDFVEFATTFHAPDYYFGERLRKSVARGQTEAVIALLVRNCNPNTSDGEGTSSLHYCCEFNRPDLIELFAKLCGQKLVVNAQDRYGWSPLHSAVHQGNKNCVSALIKLGANVNIANNVGKTPLHTAAAQNRGAIATLLLAAKANLNQQDKQGMTPVHEAAYRGQMTLYTELSQHPTANMTVRDVLGNLPSDYLDDVR